MTQEEVTKHIESKIMNSSNATGHTIEFLWLGIHPDFRYLTAFSLLDLINQGKVERCEKRVDDGFGGWETVCSFRKRFA